MAGYDLDWETSVLLRSRPWDATFGWVAARPDMVAIRISEGSFGVERWFPRWLLAAGMDSPQVDGDVRVEPGVDAEDGFVVLHPSANAPSMLLPETALGQFLAAVEARVAGVGEAA